VYPVPFSGSFIAKVNSKFEEMAVVSLVSQAGVPYQIKRMLLTKGSNRLLLNKPAHLSDGIYFLVIQSDKQRWTNKVIAVKQ
jgi:hypothetical protein